MSQTIEQVAGQARVEERARCKAILQHEEATGREALALHLATRTDMPVEEAVEMLRSAPRQVAPVAPASPPIPLILH